MKAILMAAGKGTRISRHIDGKPKCTVDLGDGTPLVNYTVELLKKNRIDDIILVLGYCGDIIKKIIGSKARYVENPFFDITNSIVSLWFAQRFLKGDESYLIMNADVFLSQEALNIVLAEKESPVLFYDATRNAEADYRFYCEDGILIKYGKDLSNAETSGEYIGCATIGKEFVPTFIHRMNELIATQHHGQWWEDVLYSMAAEIPLRVRDIRGAFWAEVDYVEDYLRIQDYYRSHNYRNLK